MSILFALLGLSIIIIIHELGHFLVARSAGVPVSEFSIGMGKSIIKKKLGDTDFSLRVFPLGGYVRIEGLEGKDADRTEISFINKLKILVSGSFSNFLFAWFVFFFIFFFNGIPGKATTRIEHVYSDGPAINAGLVSGDVVLKVNGENVYSGSDFVKKLAEDKPGSKTLIIKRGEALLTYNIVPKVEAGRNVIGVRLYVEKEPAFQIIKSLNGSWKQIIDVLILTFKGLGMLLSREIGVDQVYGPVGIIDLTSQATKLGITYFFSFLAILSINLSIFNLLPIPALDGGRIFILLIDKIFGEKISSKIENKLHFIGFIILILLVMYISYFDIKKLLLK